MLGLTAGISRKPVRYGFDGDLAGVIEDMLEDLSGPEASGVFLALSLLVEEHPATCTMVTGGLICWWAKSDQEGCECELLLGFLDTCEAIIVVGADSVLDYGMGGEFASTVCDVLNRVGGVAHPELVGALIRWSNDEVWKEFGESLSSAIQWIRPGSLGKFCSCVGSGIQRLAASTVVWLIECQKDVLRLWNDLKFTREVMKGLKFIWKAWAEHFPWQRLGIIGLACVFDEISSVGGVEFDPDFVEFRRALALHVCEGGGGEFLMSHVGSGRAAELEYEGAELVLKLLLGLGPGLSENLREVEKWRVVLALAKNGEARAGIRLCACAAVLGQLKWALSEGDASCEALWRALLEGFGDELPEWCEGNEDLLGQLVEAYGGEEQVEE
jgi:hypothetical protein